MKVVGIITARGGSKGIPGKNLRLLSGEPLICHTVKAALGAKGLSGVLVSSDSEDILAAAKGCGGVFTVHRPPELAGDASPTIDAVLNALDRYESGTGEKPELIMLLQPTAPLRMASDIDAAIRLFESAPAGTRSLISCYDATSIHPSIMYRLGSDGLGERIWAGEATLRRQEFEKVFVRNGAIYLARREWVVAEKRLYDESPLLYEMPRERSINIDEETDLILAQALLAAKGNPPRPS